MFTYDAAPVREFIFALCEPASARHVLDLGCGDGTEVVQLAAHAPRDTRFVGLDRSPASIAGARRAAAGDARLDFSILDVAAGLPFEAGAFDRVLSVNLLECVPDKDALVREVHRVLAPGGTLVFAHWDWDSVAIDADDKALVRKLVHAFADWKQAWMSDADGWMGRRLWRIFQRSGLFDGEVHPFVYTSTRYEPGTYGRDHIDVLSGLARRGHATAREIRLLRAQVEDRARRDEYFFSLNMYVYVGRPRAGSG